MYGNAQKSYGSWNKGAPERLRSSVPRYFLHIVRGDTRIPDPEGEELPDLASARESAAESAFDLTIENLRRTGRVSEVTIEIADEAGNVLASVSFPPVKRETDRTQGS